MGGLLERQFRKLLINKGLRHTKERVDLLEGLLSLDGHYNVEQLIFELRKKGFRVSRDTVYRNLPLLQEAGVMRASYHLGRDIIYETRSGKRHHDHLRCRQCGKVVEFYDPNVEKAQKRVARKAGFELEFHYHQLIGMCSKCLKKIKKRALRIA